MLAAKPEALHRQADVKAVAERATSAPDRSLRIDVVSMHYYAPYLERSLKRMMTLSASLPARRCVLVSNNPALLPALLSAAGRSPNLGPVLGHDNTGLEFGAYQVGLEHLLAGDEPDWVVVLNDTFAIHQSFSVPLQQGLVRAIHAAGLSPAPIIVGQLESLPRSYLLDGRRSHRWVTTNAFALNRPALRVLGDRLYRAPLDRLILTTPKRESFFSSDMDPALREHLDAWLFTSTDASGWYDAAPLDAGNAAKYARKARCILQEKDISARLEEGAAIFVDIKILSTADQIRHRFEERLFDWRHKRRR